MTRLQFERLVILFDEWAGICVLLWLRYSHDEAFTWFLIAWAVLVYGVSYPSYWLKIRKENQNEAYGIATREILEGLKKIDDEQRARRTDKRTHKGIR